MERFRYVTWKIDIVEKCKISKIIIKIGNALYVIQHAILIFKNGSVFVMKTSGATTASSPGSCQFSPAHFTDYRVKFGEIGLTGC